MNVIRNPDFKRLLVGASLSTFGDSALYLTLGMWAKTLTGSNAAAGSVFLALGLPTLFGPLLGHIADRCRRRSLILITNTLMGAVLLSLLAVRSASQVWIIYMVAFCYGVAFAVLNAASAALRKLILDDDELASANAVLQTAMQGLRIVSPLVGAALFAAFGGAAVAVLDVATFAAANIALLGLRVEEPAPQPADGEPFHRQVTAGLRYVLAVPALRQTTLASACAFGVLGIGETVIFAVISTGLHRTVSFFGVTNSVQGAGAIVAGLIVTLMLRRTGETRTIGLSLACFAAAALCYRVPAVPFVLAGAALDGIGSIWLSVAVATSAQRFTPLSLQGRVNAVVFTAITGPQTVSIALGAILISQVDYRLLLACMALLTGACAIALLVRPADARQSEPAGGSTPAAALSPNRSPEAAVPAAGGALPRAVAGTER